MLKGLRSLIATAESLRRVEQKNLKLAEQLIPGIRFPCHLHNSAEPFPKAGLTRVWYNKAKHLFTTAKAWPAKGSKRRRMP